MAHPGVGGDRRAAWRAAARDAGAGAALVLAVLAASVFARLVRADPGYEDALVWVRLGHRLCAMAVSLLVLVLAARCWALRRERAAAVAVAAALLLLTVFLTFLGRATQGNDAPVVVLGNLLGGLAMFGLLWWLRLDAALRGAGCAALAERGAWIGVGLLAAQLCLGALLAAARATGSCPTLPDCAGSWWPQFAILADTGWMFTPPAPQAPGAGPLGQSLHLLHRLGAAAVLAVWVWIAARAAARRSSLARACAAVALMLLLQTLLGAAAALEAPPWAAVAHNVWAAFTLAAALGAAVRPGPAHSSSADEACVSEECQTVTSK